MIVVQVLRVLRMALLSVIVILRRCIGIVILEGFGQGMARF